MNTPLLFVLIILAGIGFAVQSALNAQLGVRVGGLPLFASTWSFLIGLIALTIISLMSGQLKGQVVQTALAQPWYYLIGGLMGAFLVTMTILAAPRIGITLTAMLIIIAQLSTALLIDKFGWLGMPVRDIGLHKIIGLSCMILGVVLFNLKC